MPELIRRDLLKGQEERNSYFVGVGTFGYSVARDLIKCSDPFGPQLILFGQDYPGIPAHMDDRPVVVLCGSLEDEAFWHTRDLVQSSEPHLLITLSLGLSLRPDSNEAVIIFDSVPQLVNSCWVIPYYGFWLGMGFAEIRTAMATTSSRILHYEAETLSTARFKAFITKNKDILGRCHRIYSQVSIVYPQEVEIEKFMAVLRGAVGADVLWEGDQAIRAGSRVEIHLVCSWRPPDL
jgi:hypothetical protein